MDRGAWQVIVHGVTESDMSQQLNNNSYFPVITFSVEQSGHCGKSSLYIDDTKEKEETPEKQSTNSVP